MAILRKKQSTADKKTEAVKAPKVVTVAETTTKTSVSSDFVIKKPRITEKASLSQEQGVYVFEVVQNATKRTIKQAITELYKVVPVRVSIARTPAKAVFSRGKRGVKSGGKKAYVYLKKGDKIEVV
jgi:large subunit ribosomal protein L23